ncbi:ARF-GAP with RHO-GAP domain, ank repeat and ph domain-containing protein 1-like [Plakobranchus ocellatus]|uniref:ARF-GAP with RHO-GAP domain, ank repeat and ph domain-containing protein 1-like n=1 Tax=Plakobranchus ocellatus TaxID=259542 RepID=A0AAV3YGY3_9GAST|nr:ARF-GAP with RHO-GAP domain, ank repeat and ph domain-containing protein 1-like [Plakobranchus ocellatus]
MAPVAVMEHVGMIDIQFAGYAYMKELVNEWRQTFLVFSWRILKFMNKDLKFDYIDLRKASSIRMQDSSNGYQNQGPCFVISSTGWSVYLQASLPRDTEKMYNCLLGAITTSGSTLSDQALTSNDIPVIVDRCITHVEVHGLMETGVYRTAGQSSRVQALLDSFRKDALSVSLSEFPISEVADTLKRFLRELDDSVFERIYYPAWISAAAWTISKQIQNKLEAAEMWFLRRMLRIPWTAKKTNERVLNEENKRRSLVRTIRKRQATFLGHVMRRGKLEHLVTTGKFEEKRSGGRQREKIMDGLASWLGPGKVSDTLAAVKDRVLWRDMIANAYKQGT